MDWAPLGPTVRDKDWLSRTMPCAAVVDMDLGGIPGEVLHWPFSFGIPQLHSALVQTEDLTVCEHHRPQSRPLFLLAKATLAVLCLALKRSPVLAVPYRILFFCVYLLTVLGFREAMLCVSNMLAKTLLLLGCSVSARYTASGIKTNSGVKW